MNNHERVARARDRATRRSPPRDIGRGGLLRVGCRLVGFGAALLGCTITGLGHPDDGFRTRLAAGCSTKQACRDLQRDAANRYSSCSDKAGDCNEKLADRQEARRLLAEQEGRDGAAKNASTDKHREEQRVEADERRRLHDLAKDMRGDCADGPALQQAIAAVPTTLPEERRSRLVAETEKGAAARRLAAQKWQAGRITHVIKQSFDVREVDNLDDVGTRIAEVRAMFSGLRCAPSEALADADLGASVDAWAAKLDAAEVEERKCRGSTECMADRAAQPLCSALADKREHQQAIAKERANPAGVVSLAYLHDLGQALQDDDARIAGARKDYAAATKRPFIEAGCKKP